MDRFGKEQTIHFAAQDDEWSPILSYRLKWTPGDAYFSNGHVICGDVTGVQGRFQNNVGQVLSVVF
jgi:hypothetical protein